MTFFRIHIPKLDIALIGNLSIGNKVHKTDYTNIHKVIYLNVI